MTDKKVTYSKKEIKQAMLLTIASSLKNAPGEWFHSDLLTEEQMDYAYEVLNSYIDKAVNWYEGGSLGGNMTDALRIVKEQNR